MAENTISKDNFPQWAWEFAQNAKNKLKNSTEFKSYRTLVKGCSALISSNGLISTLAYLTSRTSSDNEGPAQTLAKQLAEIVLKDLKIDQQEYKADEAIKELIECESWKYMAVTTKVMSHLQWLRQFVDVLKEDKASYEQGR